MMQRNEVILWAESQAEAEDFLGLLNDEAVFDISEVYVAKRSKGKRDVGHQYLQGTYFPYDREREATIEESIEAPDFVTTLVQWCSPDLILTDHKEALLTIESTYHALAWNNVAQRIPRQIRSAYCGVPSVIFQKLPAEYQNSTFVSWFIETFVRATAIYGVPCLALTFTETEFEQAKDTLVDLVNHRITDSENFEALCLQTLAAMKGIAGDYSEEILIHGQKGHGRTWLNVSEDTVEVVIGVKDNCAATGIPNYGCQGNDEDRAKFRRQLRTRPQGEPGCVWLSKGTGGMDPYPGLVKMAEILLAYDSKGRKSRQIVTRFSKLPRDFWWFRKNKEEIYYKLVHEFSDAVSYAETYG